MSHWETKTLGEVAYLAGRIGWKGLTAKEYTTEGPFFLSVHALNYGDYVDFRDAFHIRQQRYDESPEIMVQSGDILICKDGAGIGKVGIVGAVPGPTTINSSLLLIRASESVEPKFLYHALCSPSFQRIVQERIDGATTPHLYQREIRTFPISLPPLPEQRRIVAILDEAFAGLATMRANAEANLKNARALFDSHLNAVFSQGGEGWREVSLSEVAKVQSGAGFPYKHQGQKEGAYPFYKVSDMNFVGNETRMTTANNWISEIVRKALGARLFPPGSLIFPKVGGAIATNKKRLITVASCVDNNLMGIIPTPGKLSSRFLEKLMLTKTIYDFSNKAALPSIRQSTVEEWRFRLPISIGEQDSFAHRVEAIGQMVDQLEATYANKLAAIDALKQSILAKAFAGELTSTDALAA